MAFSIKFELHVHFHKSEKNKEMNQKEKEGKKQAEAFCRLVADEIERQKRQLTYVWTVASSNTMSIGSINAW